MELTDAEVLAGVRAGWDGAATGVEHLAVGFGAHHWRADVGGRASLFVTYDRLGDRHTAETLEAAYAGAIQLREAGLEFVLAPVPARSGRVLVPAGRGALSCTPWVDGRVVGEGPVDDPATAAANISDLARLHTAETPFGVVSWSPRYDADLGDRLADLDGERLDQRPVRGADPSGDRRAAPRGRGLDASVRRPRRRSHGPTLGGHPR